jgi:maltooligosyltrehalose trehalohydrolase
MLFQGEEFAASSPFLYFAHHADPEVARAVSEGRRREFAAFGWNPEQIPDPQDAQTFERSKLDWSEIQREPHAAMLLWHQQLIALRKEIPALSDGRLDQVSIQFDDREKWMVVRRGPIVIAFNLSGSPRTVPLPFAGAIVLSSGSGGNRVNDALHLPPDSVVVVREDFACHAVLKL